MVKIMKIALILASVSLISIAPGYATEGHNRDERVIKYIPEEYEILSADGTEEPEYEILPGRQTPEEWDILPGDGDQEKKPEFVVVHGRKIFKENDYEFLPGDNYVDDEKPFIFPKQNGIKPEYKPTSSIKGSLPKARGNWKGN